MQAILMPGVFVCYILLQLNLGISPHDECGAVGIRHAVFVNFYFPSDSDLLKNTIMSAIEQIHQIGSSLKAMAPSPTNLQPVVYYSTIGDVSGGNSTHIDEVCLQYNGQMKCHHSGHFGEGFEDVMLNTLYDYITAKNRAIMNHIEWLTPTTKGCTILKDGLTQLMVRSDKMCGGVMEQLQPSMNCASDLWTKTAMSVVYCGHLFHGSMYVRSRRESPN